MKGNNMMFAHFIFVISRIIHFCMKGYYLMYQSFEVVSDSKCNFYDELYCNYVAFHCTLCNGTMQQS